MITTNEIRPGEDLEAAFDTENGAVVVFAGVVRSSNDGRAVTRIRYDAYPELAEREMARLIEEVEGEYAAVSIRVTHRVGDVPVGEVSLLVVARAPHRDVAFAATERIVSEIKRRVPIWKKEFYGDDSSRWL